MQLEVKTKDKIYPLILERGAIRHIKDYIQLNGEAFLISDTGVPKEYKEIILEQFPEAKLFEFKQGEASKNYRILESIHEAMLEAHLSRKDYVIALGGGVVGDISGFAAATYMRGIRYINIPTTSLAQIDSSIGGKTAIDMGKKKNCVGAFWQPDAVIVDVDTLKTLDKRQFHNGLAEAVKAGLIKDKELFSLFEKGKIEENIEEIIERSLRIKKEVVEKDEREQGERKLLNFGHSYGHAYESYYDFDQYLHGECVAMGMMTILKNEEIKERLKIVLEKLELPISCEADKGEIARLVMHDKKADHNTISIVQVDEIGKAHLEQWSMEEIRSHLG
ncbi:MAG: 3-dehydroquinate synthase [Solobacterium sp.]|nr:3-dehydroquinate synthase [Solobacterium sp.]